MVDVGSPTSFLGSRYISDTTILHRVGLLTYLRLYLTSPKLYRPVEECENARAFLRRASRHGHRSRITDLEAWFSESFTPRDLKAEIVRGLLGEKISPRIGALFDSSTIQPIEHEFGFGSWLITILISAFICLAFLLIFVILYRGGVIFKCHPK